jgi:predicted dehydrogenase
MAKFRVAVIGRTGHGNYGHGLDTAWLEFPEAVEVVAVADDDPAGLAAAAKRLKTDHAYADYRQMLDEAKPQIVTICQRWIDRHREMALECLNRGMHVYIEKPLCRTLAEADELVAAAERTHARLVISHQTRYSPRIAVVKQLIADGKIGRVLEYRGRGKEDRRGGGEDLWVLGTHMMDMIRAIGGQPTWCFATVQQAGRPIEKKDVIEGAEGIGPLAGDDVRAMYGMPDGSTAYFASQRNAGGKQSRYGLQIFGTQGILEIMPGHVQPTVRFLADPGWSPGRTGAAWVEVSTAGIGQPEPIREGSLHAGNLLIIKDLLSAIEDHREPLGNLYEARSATEMIVAVFESQRVGGPVALPLKTRENPLTLMS